MAKVKDLSLNDTVDKTLVGLSNVDNTSDANKPVSTSQATAIALKANGSGVNGSIVIPAVATLTITNGVITAIT